MYCWVFQHQNCRNLRHVLFPCIETCQEWLSFHSSDNATLGNRSTELRSHGFTSALNGYWLTCLLCLRWSLPNILKHPGNPHDVGRGRVHIPSFGRIARWFPKHDGSRPRSHQRRRPVSYVLLAGDLRVWEWVYRVSGLILPFRVDCKQNLDVKLQYNCNIHGSFGFFELLWGAMMT